MLTPVSDEERRSELRGLLIQSRARLNPADVGLPETRRRRVTGLRREEVAELAGVSSDWYRSFESGRPIRPSAPFLARLAHALRLSPLEQRTLYYLAVADSTGVPQGSPQDTQLSPIQSFDEVENVVRQLADAKERFFSDSFETVPKVRPRIVNSWRRCFMAGVDGTRLSIPAAAASNEALGAARDVSKGLLDAAAPTLTRLKGMLADSGYAVITADASGCVLDVSADSDTVRALSRIDFVPGGDLSEAACGTNAIGTAIVDERPVQLIGAENFCEGGSNLTCTAAPIRDPVTLEIAGVLDVTAHYRRIHPEILSVVVEAALEIEERLLTAR
jgi:transcriptional regulator with XRE-family HTH domain